MSDGALIFAIFLFHVIILLAVKFLGPYETMSASISEDSMKERAYALHGPEGAADAGVPLDMDDEVCADK